MWRSWIIICSRNISTRALGDPEIYKSPNTVKLTTNYFIGFAQLSERYAMKGDRENTVRCAWGAFTKTPNDFSKRALLYPILVQSGMGDALYKEFLSWERERDDFKNSLANRLEFYMMFPNSMLYDELREVLHQESESVDFLDIGQVKPEERFYFAVLLTSIDDSEQANELIEKEKEATGGIPDVASYSPACVQYRLGEPCYDVIKQYVGYDVNTLVSFATQLMQYRQDILANRVFSDLVENNPESVDAWRAYGYAMVGLERYTQALRAVERLKEIAPDDRMAEQARTVIRQHIEQRIGDPSVLDREDK